MKCAISVLSGIFCFLALLGQNVSAESFAALTITPKGAEVVDIATGVTTLPDGGRIVDAERDLQLESDYLRFVEGEFIETRETTVTGAFGTLRASELYVDLEKNEISAEGEVAFTGSGLQVSADRLTLFLDAEVARLEGQVESISPSFKTGALLLDLSRHSALLVSPYAFQNGPFTLQQEAAGSLLELRQDTLPDGSRVYNPTTEVEADLLQALGPYLP